MLEFTKTLIFICFILFLAIYIQIVKQYGSFSKFWEYLIFWWNERK